ncbi:MAG: alanine dehydrogenase [Actinobacteria bacterium]|nr:alanine dehydrogenase [Actinomycetota bacterium]
MNIGIPREIKSDEYRVSLTPAAVRELVTRDHAVYVEMGAGLGSRFSDAAYENAGAVMVPDGRAVFERAELLLKIKEPQPTELALLEPRHILFTYLHLAPDRELTHALAKSGATCVAYETVETDDGDLPLLAPMSEIAGRLAAQTAAYLLERIYGGKGKLIGGVTGVPSARVCILGAGVAGTNAALIAGGMRARVTVLDVSLTRLQEVERLLPNVECIMSNQTAVEELVKTTDVLIGAALVPGARTPQLVSEDLVEEMEQGSVIVDLSVDQGGCVATSRMTTHSHPTYITHDVVHCCVGNMSGVVPVTATSALTNSTLPFVLSIAEEGLPRAAQASSALARGINVMEGKVTNRLVADATGFPFFSLDSVLPIDFG